MTGLLVGPQGLGMLMVMPFTGRLTERLGGGRLALAGVTVLCLSTIPLCFIGTTTSILAISVVLLVRGVGIGLAFVPAMSVAFASMRPDQLSDASPQLNVVQRLGGAIGTAVLAVVLQRSSGAIHTPAKLAGAFGTAYTWSLALSALALIPCVLLMRAESPRMAAPRRPPPSGPPRPARRASSRWARRSPSAGRARARVTPGAPGPPRTRWGTRPEALKGCDSGPAKAGGAEALCYIRSCDAGQPEAVAEPVFAPLKKWRPRDDNDAERVQADVLRAWARGAPFFAF